MTTRASLSFVSVALMAVVLAPRGWGETGGAARAGAPRDRITAAIARDGLDCYRQLIAVPDNLEVVQRGGVPPHDELNRWPQTSLDGPIWLGQQAADTTWAQFVRGFHRITPGEVARPDLSAYWTDHWSVATEAPRPADSRWFLGARGAVTFLRSSAPDPTDSSCSLLIPPGGLPEVHVSGTVVWMFDRGLRSEQSFIVFGSGAPDDCLILVARPCAPPSDPIGLWFLGGVFPAAVPMILVSDGAVRIEHLDNFAGDSRADYLSIYASSARIMGPIDPGTLMLSHPPAASDTVIDRLQLLSVLPPKTATPTRLEFFLGSVVDGGIEVRWRFGDGSDVLRERLERAASPGGPWTEVAGERRQVEAATIVIDRVDAALDRAFYRLVVTFAGGEEAFFGPLVVSLSVPVPVFAVSRIVPNPSRGAAEIEYRVAARAPVRVTVVDVQGRVLAVLADGVQDAGDYHVTWNRRGGGSRAPAGLYFARLESPARSMTRRFVLTP